MSEEVSLKGKSAMGDWTEEEIGAFGRRVGWFAKAGMSDMDAEQLAQQMLYRDRPQSCDDRRICVECVGFRKGVCTFARKVGVSSGFRPLWNVLQRCDGFSLRGAA